LHLGRTRLFDLIGNVYTCSQIQIGDKKSETSLILRFPKETPVKADYTFTNVPSQTSEFDSLEIHFNFSGGGRSHFLNFKNIKIDE
jgi:hypothetical protein